MGKLKWCKIKVINKLLKGPFMCIGNVRWENSRVTRILMWSLLFVPSSGLGSISMS